MTKELESLNYVWYNYYTEELSRNEVEQIEKHLNIVQDGLKRLEAIDNAKSNEALECLEYLSSFNLETDILVGQTKAYNTIKQTLLKAQENEEILEIIKEKNVDILDIRMSKTVDSYNFAVSSSNLNRKELTKKEFDLVKRYCDKKGKGE